MDITDIHSLLSCFWCYFPVQVKLKLLHLYSVLLLIDILAFFFYVATAGAYDPLDPTGTVTMKWDIMFWTTDGYIVSARSIAQIMTKFIIPYAYSIKANDSNMTCWNWAVMMVLLQKTSQAIVILNNFQTFRHFMKPGWTIGPTKLVPSNRFLTPDGPRRTKALSKSFFPSWIHLYSYSLYNLSLLKCKQPAPHHYPCFYTVTWNVTCTYSQFMARRNLNCWVSLNFLQSDTHSLPNLCLRLPKQWHLWQVMQHFHYLRSTSMNPRSVVFTRETKSCNELRWRSSDSRILQLQVANTTRKDNSSLPQCTHHVCQVRVHWHVKVN